MYKNKLILFITTFIGINLISLPLANAAVGQLETKQIYAIAGLSLIVVGLFFYLFDVILRPEKY
ncbi:potassium-transporting ATPase subunit F [Calothrix sp. NIES-3974]|uniref:potassium-transporting ATPase subunit F n=1 Tax=Calothrix sp. NIES-3974 TaxID=2005462 RepID=UPI000B5E946D|nr:potassium-transporting ATPase subunit F [Calothrix sp. NIES-3974]BAZ06428.1 hypothetical protein NIES3974_30890 [Calothrix sp. NIES-3974]